MTSLLLPPGSRNLRSLLLLLPLLVWTPLQAADKAAAKAVTAAPGVGEGFEDYSVDSTFTTKQIMGADGNGWTTGWRTGGSYSLPKGTIMDSAPVGTGKYLSGTVTTQAAHEASSGAITRAFAATTISGPFTISFRFRPDSTPADVSYMIGDTQAASAFGPDSSSSWKIASINGTWQFFDGATNSGSNNYIDTGMAVTAGTIYEMTVTIDPTTHTWKATISDGKASVTQEELNSRAATFDMDQEGAVGSRWLTFAIKEVVQGENPTVGTTGGFSVDSIAIRY